MSDYAQDARDADAAFREDGQKITLTRKTKGAYANGAVTITATTADAWGIDTAVSSHAIGTTTQSGTLVKAGDRKLIISALDDTGAALSEPAHGDTALVGTKLCTVRNVDPLSPGGVAVLYNLIVGI
jgi:hypothetical protein